MKLYLIHTGYYNPSIMGGLYEQHTNYFVVAKNLKDAKQRARMNLAYKRNKMHIDGIQELNGVDGYRIKLVKEDLTDDIEIYGYEDVKNIN